MSLWNEVIVWYPNVTPNLHQIRDRIMRPSRFNSPGSRDSMQKNIFLSPLEYCKYLLFSMNENFQFLTLWLEFFSKQTISSPDFQLRSLTKEKLVEKWSPRTMNIYRWIFILIFSWIDNSSPSFEPTHNLLKGQLDCPPYKLWQLPVWTDRETLTCSISLSFCFVWSTKNCSELIGSYNFVNWSEQFSSLRDEI